jgi:MATE family multidrug resistance protein
MREEPRQPEGWGFGDVLRISAPASMSGLNRVATQFIDGKMVAFLGSATVAGQAMGGMMAFMLESFARGMLGVVNTYVSQNLGAGRLRRCSQYAWAGAILVLAFAPVICPLAIFAPDLFALVGHRPDVQLMEVLYFRFMVLAIPLTLTIRVLEGFFYGIHRPGIVYVVSVLACLLNVAGNWLLIYGKAGMPAMGLKGAAVASVAAWAVQLAVLLGVFLSRRFHRRYGTRLIRAVRARQCKQIIGIGVPSGAHTFMDIATWTFFMQVLVGHFGTVSLVAASHAMRYMRISFVPMIGTGIAATVMVGKDIGVGRLDAVRRHTHAAVLVAVAYMGLCAVAFTLFREQMIGYFVGGPGANYTPAEAAEIIAIGSRMLIFLAIFQTADGVNMVVAGALRGAGDTRWPMWAMGVTTLVVLVGCGSLLTWLLPGLRTTGPFSAAAATYVILAGAMAWRFRSGAWRRIDLLGQRHRVTVAAPAIAPVAPPTLVTVRTPDDGRDE